MRITGGILKGRRICYPMRGIPGVRPAMDMVREAVFSVIRNHLDLDGVSVLDLYSGSGSYGFEALSRGASDVQFVEKQRKCSELIKKTAEELNLDESVRVYSGSVKSFFSEKVTRKYDLLFADPPYNTVSLTEMINSLKISDVMAESAILVYECDRREVESLSDKNNQKDIQGMSLITLKKYSAAAIAILRNES